MSLLPKKGGGAPKGAPRLPRLDEQARPRPDKRDRSPFGAPPRSCAGIAPDSAWAALPGTTGCKREDPLRHQCSEHLAVRRVPDGLIPKPPAGQQRRTAPAGTAPAPSVGVTG